MYTNIYPQKNANAKSSYVCMYAATSLHFTSRQSVVHPLHVIVNTTDLRLL